MIFLTIAIPTYNRPDKIKSTISQLLPQYIPQIKISVLDNCSDVPVKEHLQEQIGADVLDKIEVIRHRVNIGADANFQRCFELCTTPYIWMIGDDDEIESNAVEIIVDEIRRYQHLDLIGINFKSNLIKREAAVFISSIDDLSRKLDHFGNWSFISTSIYRTEAYLEHLQYSSWGTYAMSSQLIPTMKAISMGKVFILSEKYIVTHAPETFWSNVQFALGLSSLLEAPVGFKKDEFLAFGKKLETWLGLYPGDALYTILKSVDYNIDLIDQYHIYIFSQLFKRSFPFRRKKLQQSLQYYQCLFLLKNKGLLKLLFKLIPKMKEKSEEKGPFKLFRR